MGIFMANPLLLHHARSMVDNLFILSVMQMVNVKMLQKTQLDIMLHKQSENIGYGIESRQVTK